MKPSRRDGIFSYLISSRVSGEVPNLLMGTTNSTLARVIIDLELA